MKAGGTGVPLSQRISASDPARVLSLIIPCYTTFTKRAAVRVSGNEILKPTNHLLYSQAADSPWGLGEWEKGERKIHTQVKMCVSPVSPLLQGKGLRDITWNSAWKCSGVFLTGPRPLSWIWCLFNWLPWRGVPVHRAQRRVPNVVQINFQLKILNLGIVDVCTACCLIQLLRRCLCFLDRSL